ncbi:MAG: HD-GYP domain-containing protein [Carboxydocellales bacterium]
MTIKIKTGDVREGMFLDAPVYSKGGQLAIARGTQVEERHITFLKREGIREIEISVKPVTDEFGHDPAKDREGNEIYRLLREEMNLAIKNAITNYSDVLDVHKEAHKTISNLYKEVTSKRHLLDCLFDIKSIDSFTYRHSINVMVISLLIGSAMGLSENDCFSLGMGALFHDIGKMKVPRDILYSESVLTDEEKHTMERHTVSGYEILIRIPDIHEDAALVALQHHERVNGSGYPHKVSKDEIHLYSSIVGIADTFEAMTSERNHRRNLMPTEIIEFMMGNSGVLFDEYVTKGILVGVSIYRIGSVVQLSNDECGVVVRANPNLPSRPVLKIIFDKYQLRVRKPIIVDLAKPENTTLSVVRVFG